MDVRHNDKSLADLEAEVEADDCGHPSPVIKAFRKRMQTIRAAMDERDFYAQKSLHFEKLKGKRAYQHSMKLNDQWRLILELEGKAPNKVVVIMGIEDYH